MKIGILGNCQSAVMANWLREMLPGDEVIYCNAGHYGTSEQEMAGTLASCDTTISQYFGDDVGSLATGALRVTSKNFILVPNFTFSGFHPDCCYLYHFDGNVAGSPLGVYHSRLIIAAFLNGLDAERTRNLFNAYVFATLGYFDEFTKAEMHFDETASAHGFSVRVRPLMDQTGAFMHTINHGGLALSRHVSREVAIMAGATPAADVPAINDEMAEDTIWPFYPELAARVNAEAGEPVFYRPAHQSTDRPREVGLDQLIAESLAHYEHWKLTLDFGPFQGAAEQISSILRTRYN